MAPEEGSCSPDVWEKFNAFRGIFHANLCSIAQLETASSVLQPSSPVEDPSFPAGKSLRHPCFKCIFALLSSTMVHSLLLFHKFKRKDRFPIIENFPRTGTKKEIFCRQERKIFFCQHGRTKCDNEENITSSKFID